MKILHDVHTHNVYSHCCTDTTASTAAYIAKEREIGNRVFGLSNHLWDESVKGASYWYRNQTILLAEEAKETLKKQYDGIRCLFGAESEFYGYRGVLGMSAEGAARFDYMIIPHSHLHMRGEVMSEYPEILEARKLVEGKLRETFPQFTDQMIRSMVSSLKEPQLLPYVPELKTNIGEFTARSAVENFRALIEHPEFVKICGTVPTSVAHPFNLCGVPNQVKNEYLMLIDDATLRELFAKAKQAGAYMEINIGSVCECGLELPSNQLMRVFALAKEAGCQFTFGTDSHSVKNLESIKIANDVCDYLNLTRADIAPYLAEDGVSD